MKDWTYVEELAFVLLTDALTSELETNQKASAADYPDIPDLEVQYRTLRREVVRPGEDLLDTLRSVCENRGVDPTPFLSLDLVRDYISRVDRSWAGKATVAELYAEDARAATRLILGAVGHGVSLGDDEWEESWLAERGLSTRTHKVAGQLSDVYHEGAWRLIGAILAKMSLDD